MQLKELLAILLLFIIISSTGIALFISAENKRVKLSKYLENTSKNFEEKHITDILMNATTELKGWDKFKAHLKVFGINTSPETMIAMGLCAFFAGFIISKLLFKAGIILMTYLGILCFIAVFMFFNSRITAQQEKLGLEFLEKLRDISTYLSVGKTIDNAIIDVLTLTKTSSVMERELKAVRRELSAGHKTSEAFENMYKRLGLEEVRIFAQSLTVFESSGGNLIEIMKAQDSYFLSKVEAKSAQNIFITSLRTSQKFVVGLPLFLLVGAFILNPGFFGDFYGTLTGQIIAIVCVSVLLLGLWLSNKIAADI